MKMTLKKILLTSIIVSIFWAVVFYGFIFDDLYISCRYALNLINGNGLVFNYGERVEGYTNFLWTMISSLFVKLPLDPSIPLKFISILFGFFSVVLTILIAKRHWNNRNKTFFIMLLMLTSPYFVIWTQPGMETSLFTFFGVLSLFFLIKNNLSLSLFSALSATLTRPEGIIFFAAIVISVIFNRGKKGIKYLIQMSILPLILLFIYHIWRITYYGDIFPNTYYVKLSGGLMRINALSNMIPIGLLLGGTFYFLFFVFTNRKKNILNTFSLTVSWLFLIYAVTGTPDFFTTFRLFTPAMPFIFLSAIDNINLEKKHIKIPILTIIFINILTILFIAFFFSQMKFSLFRSHGKIASILSARADSGDIVLSQEMGLIPYNNPDLYFFDVIGLVTEEVSMKLYEEGMNPYTMYYISLSEQGHRRVTNLKVEMREMFFKVDPDWIITVAYPPWDLGGKLENNYRTEQGKNTLLNYTKGNIFFYDMMQDPRFNERYELYGIYPAHRIYYLFLFHRKSQ